MEDAGDIVLDSSRKLQVPPSVLRVDWAQGTLLRQARRILSLSHFLFQGSHPHSHIQTAALPVSPFAQGPLQPSCPSYPSQFCINPSSALRYFTKSFTPSFSESYVPEVGEHQPFFYGSHQLQLPCVWVEPTGDRKQTASPSLPQVL